MSGRVPPPPKPWSVEKFLKGVAIFIVLGVVGIFVLFYELCGAMAGTTHSAPRTGSLDWLSLLGTWWVIGLIVCGLWLIAVFINKSKRR